MKILLSKVTLWLSVLLLTSLAVMGQGTWNPQTSGTTSNLNCIYFTSATKGWAVGMNGTLLNTSNEGGTWNAVNTGISATLHGVHFTNTSTGWIVGENRTIKKTADAGLSWTSQDWINVTHSVVKDLVFLNSLEGVAVGDTDSIALYDDGFGGNLWSGDILSTGTIGYGNTINRIHQVNGLYISMVGNNGVVLNGVLLGFWMDWSNNQAITTANLNDVSFPDVGNGWVVGDNGGIFHSTDTGATWIAQTSGTPNNLNGVYFTDTNTGWAVGDNGTILFTSNGGSSWTVQNSGVTAHLRNVNFPTASNGWIAGDNGTILNYTFTTTTENKKEAIGAAVLIYPNPNKGVFTLEVENSKVDDVGIVVLNGLGQEVLNQKISGLSGTYTKEFDFSGLGKGVYQIRVTTGKGTVSKQVLVE